MDETVDSFLKEINKIVPPQSVWEECYDEKSGFTYYWNTKTDEVTWDVPADYKKQGPKMQGNKKKLYIPPPSEEKIMLGTIPHVSQDSVKIYKIDEIKRTPSPIKRDNKHKSVTKNKPLLRRPSSGSEDEKIVLISSYGTDSSSDDEIEVPRVIENESLTPPLPERNNIQESYLEKRQPLSPYNSEDETDILTQIQTKAKMLKQMGGEIPESVKSLVNDTNEDKGKEISGYSLVAGYGDDSEEESEYEDQPNKSIFPLKNTKPLSTLFPISNAPSPTQCQENEPVNKADTSPEESVDVKAFQRKRRIGVSLVNVQKRPNLEQDTKPVESERPGFGFKGGTSKEYPGFKSGGVMFCSIPEKVQSTEENDNEFVKASDENLLKEIEEFQNTLNEKLKFLCEGHGPALPVQIMIIQMETLYTAMKEKCLKPTYLQKWLDNTCQDLSKLEEEAAPAGWLLQWDRYGNCV